MKASDPEYLQLRRDRIKDTFQLDPVTPITLKGQQYKIEFNNWTVKEILKDLGVNLLSEPVGFDILKDPEKLGRLLFWALSTNHPELKQEDVDKMFTLKHLLYVRNCIGEAMELYLPDMDDIAVEPEEGEASPS
jgi:hypothetical protein